MAGPAPRAGAPGPGIAAILLAGALALGLLAGCGQKPERGSDLGFEELSDTTGLSRGAPILTAFEPYRLNGGAMRLRGTARLPDGTRLQVSIVRAATGEKVYVLQVVVRAGGFETPPFMSPRGPLPVDRYRFDVLAHFNPAWQPEEVLRATQDGRSLRGPGMTRGTAGQAAFMLHEEHRL